MERLVILISLILAVHALSDLEAWNSFKVDYSKTYTAEEEKLRFDVFKTNLLQIEQHNVKYKRGESSYYLKINEFADWTKEEFASKAFNKAYTKEMFENMDNRVDIEVSDDVPTSIDWREKNAVTSVKNYVRNGHICVAGYAFSACGSLEGQMAIQKNQLLDLSVEQLLECSSWNSGCEAGMTSWAFYDVEKNGLASDEHYPYTAMSVSCQQDLMSNPVLGKTSSHIELNTNETVLLNAVGTIGPISSMINATNLLFYGGGIYDEECQDIPNTDVLVVGYDSADGVDFWIIKNSWGTSWGEKGYIRLPRNKNQCSIQMFNVYPVL